MMTGKNVSVDDDTLSLSLLLLIIDPPLFSLRVDSDTQGGVDIVEDWQKNYCRVQTTTGRFWTTKDYCGLNITRKNIDYLDKSVMSGGTIKWPESRFTATPMMN